MHDNTATFLDTGKPAYLMFEDGTVLQGKHFGAEKPVYGEIGEYSDARVRCGVDGYICPSSMNQSIVNRPLSLRNDVSIFEYNDSRPS